MGTLYAPTCVERARIKISRSLPHDRCALFILQVAIGKIKPGETPFTFVDNGYAINKANTGAYTNWADLDNINGTTSSVKLYPKIINAGKKVLVYSGDNDVIISSWAAQKFTVDVGRNISSTPGWFLA